MRFRRPLRHSLIGGVILTGLLALPAAGAVSRFLDVSDSNTFLADIEWLADGDVTRGCGPDLFCPDTPVTRAQMAAFLHRLSTNELVNAATAVNAESAQHAATADSATTAYSATTADSATTAASAADSALLDGRAAASYDTFVIGDARHAGDMGGYLTICTEIQMPYCPAGSVEGVLIAEATFSTLTANSTVAVTGTTSLNSLETIDPISAWVWLQMDSSTCTDSVNAGSTAAYVRQTLLAGSQEAIPVTVAFEIPTAGDHTITMCAQPVGGNVGVLASTISGVVSGSPNSVTSQHFVAP
jgi:hypothetical protein